MAKARNPRVTVKTPQQIREMTRAAERAPDGKWLPGTCPNPGGQSLKVREVRSLALENSESALRRLVEIMTQSDDIRMAGWAAKEVLSIAGCYPRDKDVGPVVEGTPARPGTIDREKLLEMLTRK